MAAIRAPQKPWLFPWPKAQRSAEDAGSAHIQFCGGSGVADARLVPLSKIKETVTSAVASNFASLYPLPPAVVTGLVPVAKGCGCAITAGAARLQRWRGSGQHKSGWRQPPDCLRIRRLERIGNAQ